MSHFGETLQHFGLIESTVPSQERMYGNFDQLEEYSPQIDNTYTGAMGFGNFGEWMQQGNGRTNHESHLEDVAEWIRNACPNWRETMHGRLSEEPRNGIRMDGHSSVMVADGFQFDPSNHEQSLNGIPMLGENSNAPFDGFQISRQNFNVPANEVQHGNLNLNSVSDSNDVQIAVQKPAAEIPANPHKLQKCKVCGDSVPSQKMNRVAVCAPCKTFFQRTALKRKAPVCPSNGKCKISVFSRKSCPCCRLKKCYEAGLKMDAAAAAGDDRNGPAKRPRLSAPNGNAGPAAQVQSRRNSNEDRNRPTTPVSEYCDLEVQGWEGESWSPPAPSANIPMSINYNQQCQLITVRIPKTTLLSHLLSNSNNLHSVRDAMRNAIAAALPPSHPFAGFRGGPENGLQ